MYPGEFEAMFRKMADLFTLDMIAENIEVSGRSIKRTPSTPIWETIEGMRGCDYVDIGDGRVVPCHFLLKIATRVLFYTLLVQFEERLFRIHEWRGKDIGELNEKNINDLIRELVDSNLVGLQREYGSRSEFKEDLKAISAFRNVVMHVNKKLEDKVDVDVVIKRKRQIVKLLSALQEILDRMRRT